MSLTNKYIPTFSFFLFACHIHILFNQLFFHLVIYPRDHAFSLYNTFPFFFGCIVVFNCIYLIM